MNKKVIFWIKLALTIAVIAFIGREVYKIWLDLKDKSFSVDARYVAGAVAAFMAFMIQSALVWRWLTRRMGDRTPAVQAVGAYTYSQMGKYAYKVGLVLMRISRAGRVGMDPQICVVATLIENAMYMVSGAIVASATLLVYQRDNWALAGMLGLGIVAMGAAFHPKVFYWLLNRVLRKMKRAEVAEHQRLHAGHMALAVIGFFPCWLLGGLSLWCATHSITLAGDPHNPPTAFEYLEFPGTVACGVVAGMAFLTPGGMGTREYMMGLFLYPIVGRNWAALAVVLQRIVQLSSELLLGGLGAIITRKRGNPAEILSERTDATP